MADAGSVRGALLAAHAAGGVCVDLTTHADPVDVRNRLAQYLRARTACGARVGAQKQRLDEVVRRGRDDDRTLAKQNRDVAYSVLIHRGVIAS